MKMNLSALLMVACLGMAACDREVDGTLTVERSFTANASASSSNQKVDVPAGSYPLTISSGPLTSMFTLTMSNGKKFKFRTPGIQSIKQQSFAGTTLLKAKDINQSFDIAVDVALMDQGRGPDVTAQRSCSCGTVQVWRCHPTDDNCHQDKDGKQHCDHHDNCGYETVDVNGTQDYTGYDTYSQRSIKLRFMKGDTQLASTDDGVEPQVAQFIETSESSCYACGN